jgi:hypothetical protein
MVRLCLRLSVLALTFSLALACSFASARVPQGFVGMNGDDPLFGTHVDLAGQLDQMVSSGVESLRVAFNWAAAQPYRRWSEVPLGQTGDFQDVGGIPTDFSATDQLVGLAAARGLRLLPTVLYTPGWDTGRHPPYTLGIPKSNAPYANFLKALIHRYGPHGSYWQADPGTTYRPIRMWQIWNEPDIPSFWPVRPFARSYVALLEAAHTAIKSADAGASVVLAGLPNYSWLYLKSIYGIRGARGAFDVVAVHPYTGQPQGVVTILSRVRAVMNAAGDRRKPIVATETGWASLKGSQSWETTEAGQASRLAALLPLLARNRIRLSLMGFYCFTWVTQEIAGDSWSDFAGLFRFSDNKFVAKPAFFAFRRAALALERCRVKGAVANRCLHPAVSSRRRA